MEYDPGQVKGNPFPLGNPPPDLVEAFLRGELIDLSKAKAVRTTKKLSPLDELDDIFRKRTVMGEAERTATCLWIAHTYIFDRGFEYTGRLLVTSMRRAHGKSAVLRLVAKCSNGGAKKESGTTLATIRDYRKSGGGTLCLDQLDGTGQLDHDDRKLLNLICSSAEVDAEIDNKEKGKGGKWVNTTAKIGFPIALGKIRLLPGEAIMSRCFVIWMQPETEEERALQMPERLKPFDHEAFRLRMRRWLRGAKAEYIKAPKGTDSRTEDIWQPLMVVAKHAGGDWPERARQAMAELQAQQDTKEDETKEQKLLRRVVGVCRGRTGKGIASTELDALIGVNEDTTPNKVQRGIWLRNLGLKSRNLTWTKGGPQVPGYAFEDVQQVAKRHKY
jgi:hypothetical protein